MVPKKIRFRVRRNSVLTASWIVAMVVAPAAIIPFALSGRATTSNSLATDAIEAARDFIVGGAVHIAEAQANDLRFRKVKNQAGVPNHLKGEAGPPDPVRERTARRFIPRREQTPEDPLDLTTPLQELTLLSAPTPVPVPVSGGNIPGSGGLTPLSNLLLPPSTFSTPPPTSGALPPDLTPSSPVPEPDTWMMLIFGFGFLGALLRRTGPFHGLSSRPVMPSITELAQLSAKE